MSTTYFGDDTFFQKFADALPNQSRHLDSDGYPIAPLPEKAGDIYDFDTAASYRTGKRYQKTMIKKDVTQNDQPCPSKPLGRRNAPEHYGFRKIIAPTVKPNRKVGYAILQDGYQLTPAQYNNPNLYGEGAAKHGNVHIRNKRNRAIVDYDSIADRFYKPAPSRRLALESADSELFKMIPSKSRYHPTTVGSNQHILQQVTKTKKNHDAHERPWYQDNERPRGLQAKQPIPVHFKSQIGDQKMPVPNSETGDKYGYNRIPMPHAKIDSYTAATQIENRFTAHAIDNKYNMEHDLDYEVAMYHRNEQMLLDSMNSYE
jgi:hypothetical protein